MVNRVIFTLKIALSFTSDIHFLITYSFLFVNLIFTEKYLIAIHSIGSSYINVIELLIVTLKISFMV